MKKVVEGCGSIKDNVIKPIHRIWIVPHRLVSAPTIDGRGTEKVKCGMFMSTEAEKSHCSQLGDSCPAPANLKH